MDEGSLYELWIQYTRKNDSHYLEAFLTAFNAKYVQFGESNCNNPEKGPLLRELPSRLLQILIHEVTRLNLLIHDALSKDIDELSSLFPHRQIEKHIKLLRAFAIISRHPENVALLVAPGVLAVFVELFSGMVTLVARLPHPIITQSEQSKEYYSLFKLSYCLLSAIFDPQKSWHSFAVTSCQKFPSYEADNSAVTRPHSESTISMHSVLSSFSTFIVDNLEKFRNTRSDIVQILLSLFGCSLSGSRENASLLLRDSRVVRCLLTIVAHLDYVTPESSAENDSPEPSSTSSISDSELAIRQLALRLLTLIIYLLSAQIVIVNLDFTVVIADCLEAFSKLKPTSAVGVQLLQLILEAFSSICNVDTRGYTSSCLIDLHLISLLSNHLNLCVASGLPTSYPNELAISSFRVMRSLCRFSKPEKAVQLIVDWPDLFAVVRKIQNPSQKLLDACLNLSHPADMTPGAPHTLVAREMLLWLPLLSKDLQTTLADRIFNYLFDKNNSELDLLTCSQHRIVDTILSISMSKELTDLAFLRVIEILHKIGAVSMTAGQLKHLIALCRPEDDTTLLHHALPLLQSLRLMLRPASESRPSAIFAFHTAGHAIHVQKIHKLPSRSTFSIFLWLRMTTFSGTRMIFRMACKNGSAVEAELSSNGIFLVTQSTAKGSQLLAKLDASALINELKWHALCICFTPVRFLTSGRVLVYLDGHQLTEPAFDSNLSVANNSQLPMAAWNGLSDLLSDFRIGGVGFEQNNGSWLMGDALIFDQAVMPDQVAFMSRVPYSELGLLSQSMKMTVKPIAHYTARCYDSATQVLEDLSGNGYFALCNIDTFNIFDVKDMFGCIGGPGVLFPFIYYAQVTHVSRKASIASNENSVPSSRYLADSLSDSNTIVSCCFACLTELLTGIAVRSTLTAINWMLANDGCASLGHLLSQLPPELITVDVLTSVQSLVDRLFAQHNEATSSGAAQKIGDQHESIAYSLQLLLQQTYQHILFNFDIWAKADYVVQVGHLQYVQQLIRPARSWFRQQYPLRFFLDIVRLHFAPIPLTLTPTADDILELPSSNKQTAQHLESENARQFIWQIARLYLSRSASYSDVQALIGFLSESSDVLICECLDTIKACLDVEPQPDQLVLLLYEPQAGELLFSFLVTDHSSETREKALQVINLLLSSKRVYEKDKTCFQLNSVDFYGLLDRMPTSAATESLLNLLFFPMFYNPENVGSLASIICYLPKCSLEVQRLLLRKINSHCRTNPGILLHFMQQCRWQPLIASIFVRHHFPRLPRSVILSSPQQLSARPDVLPSLSYGGGDDSHVAISGRLELCYSTADNSLASSVPQTPQKCGRNGDTDVALIDLTSDDADILTSPQIEERPVFAIESPTPSHKISNQRDLSWRQEDSTSIRTSSPHGRGSLQSTASTLSELAHTPLSESERAVLSAVLDFLHLLLTSSMPKLSLHDQIKEIGILLANFRDLETHRPLMKSAASITARLLCFVAQQMLSYISANGRNRSPTNAPIDKRGHQSSPPRIILPRDALQHFVELTYDACSSSIWIITNKNKEVFTTELLNSTNQLLSNANVWDDEKLSNIGQLGLAILLQFCSQPDLDLCTCAAEHVQTLLQTGFIRDAVQFGYLISTIYEAASTAESNNFYTLMPILKTALARMRELVDLRFPLPTLQFGHGSFSESFQSYSGSNEWNSFMNFQALPWKAKFMADYLAVAKDRIAGDYVIWQSEAMTRQEVMNNLTSGSWASFQERILHPFMARTRGEHSRVADFARLLIAERETRLSAFTHLSAFLMGDCGPWARHTIPPSYWKLGALENLNRMRLVLVHNFNFDPHISAHDAENYLQNSFNNSVNNNNNNDFSGLLMAIRADESSRGNDEDDWTSVSAIDAVPSSPSLASTSSVEAAVEAAPAVKAVIDQFCDLVSIAGIISGRLEVTAERFAFTPTETSGASPMTSDDADLTIQFPFEELKDVYLRRYNLQKTALEVFLVDCRNFMFNFTDKASRNKAFVRLIGLKNQNRTSLFNLAPQNPKALLKASGITQKWVNREMTNFDYLMALNTFAGRTYNDLSQYPVFPWIIADYSSSTLDLNNPATFRDLSKPMGIQNKKREEEVRDKYDHFEDPTGELMHKFHYGTHYSNAGSVMYYLLRVEPFTSLHIDLQSGHFDVPDRLFNSIPGLWRSLYDGNDVKELIPEFFYLPEFLVNSNEFDFGRLQMSNEKVDNVHLPAWADSPEDFIYKHRQALECDYVSNNLHLWIDLIFGYKQRGQAAVDATNVYHACTYEDMIDLDSIKDPERRKTIEAMVTHFGQTPSQLFTDAHPKRLSIEELFRKVAAAPAQFSVPLLMASFSLQAVSVQTAASFEPISFMAHASADSLIAITRSGSIRLYTISGNRADMINIQGGGANEINVSSSTPRPCVRLAGIPRPSNFAVLDNGLTLAVVGYHDNSLRLINTKSGKLVAAVRHHALSVTCVSLSRCNRFIATGSVDVTVAIFKIQPALPGHHSNLLTTPHCVLFGHDAPITAVALSSDLDLCWSCAENGLALAHTVRKGRYVRSVRLVDYLPGINQVKIEAVKIGPEMNEVIFYASTTPPLSHNPSNQANRFLLCTFTINGRYLSSLSLRSPVCDFALANDAIVFADARPRLSIRRLYKFQQLSPVAVSSSASTSEMTLERPASALTFSRNSGALFVALDDGRLLVISVRTT